MYLKSFSALPTPKEFADGGGSFVKHVSSAALRSPAAALSHVSAPRGLRNHVWVPTRYIAKMCNWRHDNLLRALKQFVRAKFKKESAAQVLLSDASQEAQDLFTERRHVRTTHRPQAHFMVVPQVDEADMRIGGRGNVAHRGIVIGDVGCYAVALPVWQEFVDWLLTHTVKFADRQARLRSLGFQPLNEEMQEIAEVSGLDAGDPCGRIRRRVESVYAEFLSEEEMKDFTHREASRAGELAFTDFRADNTIGIRQLADFLGYKPRRLVDVLAQSTSYLGAEERALHADAGTLDQRISFKAAMYLLLKLPKAQKQRLMMFNALFDKLQTPRIALEDGRPDFNNPVATRQAYLSLEHTCRYFAAEVDTVRREKVELDSQLRVAVASKEGLEVRAAQLEKGLVLSAAAGNLAADNVDDHIVRNASQLRREHNLMGKKDVLQDLSRFLHDQALAHLLLNQTEMFAMLTWWTCEKFRDANGAPVIRHTTRQNDLARRYQVYASGAGQEGAFQKHAATTKTAWMVFFTPKGVETFRNSFTQLRELWIAEGRPKAALDRSTQEVVAEVEAA